MRVKPLFLLLLLLGYSTIAGFLRDVIIVAPTELQKNESISRSTWQDTRTPPIRNFGSDLASVQEEPVTYS